MSTIPLRGPIRIELILLFIILVVFIVLFIHSKRKGQTTVTPTLSMYSRDLTLLASENLLDPVIGRNQEIERVILVLSRRNKNNPVLVGKSGVGKTAIAEGLAQAIVHKKVPQTLFDKHVLALDLPSIVAGTKYRGEFEQRLKKIADEIISAKRKIILFIDEIHILAEAGEATGAIGADDILKPALARGDLQVVGATTREEYINFIKKDPTLDRRLHPILIDEPSPEETLEILNGIKKRYEAHHHVIISREAIHTAVTIAEKYIKDKFFPDKAIDLIDEASSMVSLEKVEGHIQKTTPQVLAEDVKKVYKEMQKDKL